jgi:hypothetical protein
VTIKALVVRADGTWEVRMIEPELEVLQQLVGGHIEGLHGADWHIYMDTDGKRFGRPINVTATVIMEQLLPGFSTRDVLVGTVVFLGNAPAGGEASVPSRIVDLVDVTVEIRR